MLIALDFHRHGDDARLIYDRDHDAKVVGFEVEDPGPGALVDDLRVNTGPNLFDREDGDAPLSADQFSTRKETYGELRLYPFLRRGDVVRLAVFGEVKRLMLVVEDV